MPDPAAPANASTTCYALFGFWVEIPPDNKTALIFEYDGSGRGSDIPVHTIEALTDQANPDGDHGQALLMARAWCRAQRVKLDAREQINADPDAPNPDAQIVSGNEIPQPALGVIDDPLATDAELAAEQIGTGQFAGQPITVSEAPSGPVDAMAAEPAPNPAATPAAPAAKRRGGRKAK